MEAKKNPTQDVHRQSGKFFLIGLTLSVALTIMAFEWPIKKREHMVCSFDDAVYDGTFQLNTDVTLAEQPKVKQVKPPVIKPTVNLITTTEPISDTPDVISFDQPVITIGIDSATLLPEPTEEPLIAPEVAPVPEGGFEGFYKFVGQNLKYPKRARHTNTQGKVFVEFVIDKNGQVTDMKVIKGIGNGCDEEAMRVLALTKWQPGRQRGRPVKVRMTMPLNFVLN
ncbi:MAG: energy transducer TonB [Cyclobacteriaceae bacterium]|nr:energy transducer TonB [Cyclobacteriaceae bacterium]